MYEIEKSHISGTYYAPRGRKRIFSLGIQLAQRYLSPFDHIIGFIGEAGSGKSVLIKGMFPGLELTNDDNGVNLRPLPLLEQDEERGFFTPHTYHVDIRFEMGFTQLSTLADAVLQAVSRGKRVIVEHFDIIYPLLHRNADLLIGVGEEIIIARPTLFGPEPQEIYDVVYQSLPYRLMAHTAEDLCEFCMPPEELARCTYDDVRHGFILSFAERRPHFSIPELEEMVLEMIAAGLPVNYVDEEHISIGKYLIPCTGPRTHVRNTGDIQDFRLLHEFVHDAANNRYLLVGCVGRNSAATLDRLKHLTHMGESAFR